MTFDGTDVTLNVRYKRQTYHHTEVESSDDKAVASDNNRDTTNDSDSDHSNFSVAEGDFFREEAPDSDENVIWTVWQ
eukprot:scaffold76578_cov23-Attheya_sp.AAC.1